MRTLFIPALGTVLKLAAPWTFTVHEEYRNKSLVELSGLRRPQTVDATRGKLGPYFWRGEAIGQWTFPAGTTLVVDRIYIRAGGETFNSVTFRARDYTTTISTGLKGKKEKVVRFWAKLADVNTMEIV